ncbi:putative cupin superfamily sugar epimerase [Azospirillum agricola]|uniref:cupin domain-containing protein n=1 Tax=Azospirillum agricola TaxID=1720247 RepID=UPI001AEAB900|nr:cupin domain-containing protein [Azospirillum agricola]MBP2227442.1 putative cupin superfamily sugar epimerase [Azospirillum agricola]
MTMEAFNADRLIALLGLQPHPEGGFYVETYRAPAEGRGAVTAIYFLLNAGERSHWHKVDAVEIWLWHGGAPLELSIHDGSEAETRVHTLGMDLAAGERPQAVVPVGAWQSARSLGDWSLVSCTVAPAFEFAGFTLAPPGWEPGPA